jgi:hypothetical protein
MIETRGRLTWYHTKTGRSASESTEVGAAVVKPLQIFMAIALFEALEKTSAEFGKSLT